MKKVALSALAAVAMSGALCADAMSLYTDPETGQVFTTPQEGRVKMGDFIDAKEVDTQLGEQAAKVSEYESAMQGYIEKDKKSWSNKLKIGGYMQFRNTEYLSGEDKLNDGSFKGYWADKSTSNDQNFLIRRARLVVSGNVGEHLGIYIQPDFASSAGTTNHIGQLRDFYGDIYYDKTKVHRVRVGQSKVPYGFENLQSSSKRLTHDRNDALNSAVRDERDIGAFYYYTPVAVQELFSEIDAKGLKSTGNYGMFALGAYNGQGANRAESNGNYHTVTRLTYPFKTQSGQIFEFGVQGYKGKYVSPNTIGEINLSDDKGIKDERIGISAIMYQQPFGLQAEWNWGKTPGADDAPVGGVTSISEKNLNGGYIMSMYRFTDAIKDNDAINLFAKWQYFDGYSKAERNSPRNKVNDWEIGFEWQAAKEVEFSTVYHAMNRSDVQQFNGYGERFSGAALRFQVQVNY